MRSSYPASFFTDSPKARVGLWFSACCTPAKRRYLSAAQHTNAGAQMAARGLLLVLV